MNLICALCNTEYSEEVKACPSCGAPNPLLEDESANDEQVSAEVDAFEDQPSKPSKPDVLAEHIDLDDEIKQQAVVPVFRAPSETVANLVMAILESEDIPVTLASRQVPWMDGVMTMGEGFYGDLLVPASEADRARLVIEAYQREE